jgi:hypothetical protein
MVAQTASPHRLNQDCVLLGFDCDFVFMENLHPYASVV